MALYSTQEARELDAQNRAGMCAFASWSKHECQWHDIALGSVRKHCVYHVVGTISLNVPSQSSICDSLCEPSELSVCWRRLDLIWDKFDPTLKLLRACVD